MYEKKFNNYSYVGCGECGITGKKKSAQTLYRNQDLKTYLTKYQWAYRNGYFLPSLPENLREIFYELKGMFNVAAASIDEMLGAGRRLRQAASESSKRNKIVQGKRRTNFIRLRH